MTTKLRGYPLRWLPVVLPLLMSGFLVAAPSDWRDEEIVPDPPEKIEGFIGLSDLEATERDDILENRQDQPAYLISPFGQEESEEEVFSIDALEMRYARQAPPDQLDNLSLSDTVAIALRQNFDLQNEARSLASSSSSRREAFANFIPFVNLTTSYNREYSRRDRTRRFDEREDPRVNDITYDPDAEEFDVPTVFRNERTNTGNYNITAQQNLPWGGDLRFIFDRDRTEVKTNYFQREGLNDTRTEAYTTDLTLQYNQPLLRGAGWLVGTAAWKRARLSEMNAAIDYALQQRDTALTIVSDYYDVLRAQLDIEVSRAALKETRAFLDETRLRYDLKQIAQSEISRAEIRFLQEKQRYVQRQQSYEQAIDDLLVSMGLSLTARIGLGSVEDQLVDLRLSAIPPLEQGLREALANRLEWRRQLIATERSRIDVKTSFNNLLPDLDADAEWRGFEDSDDRSSGEDLEIRREYETGISLSIPIPNIERREQYYRSKLSYETALNNLADLERTITLDVKRSYRNLRTSELSTQILARTVEEARRSLVLENARYEAGLNSSTEVTDAQLDLFQAQTDYNQALLQQQVNISTVYRALGRDIF